MNKRIRKRNSGTANQALTGIQTPWILGLLALAAFLLYLNTIGHSFVFDDITLIVQNPQVQNFDIYGIFSLQGYRPVRTLTHALEWALVGDNPALFHIDNILLHVFNVLLLFLFLKKLTRSRMAALAGSLVFMVHPVQTAAVAYISGRKDLLATAFLLLGFWFYMKSGEAAREAPWRKPLAWGCFGLGLLSKEVAIVFPALMLGLDMVTDRSGDNLLPKGNTFLQALGRALRSRPYQYAAFSVVAVAALAWAVFINGASRAVGYWGGSFQTNLGTGFKLFAHYLKLVFLPYPLIADYTGNVFQVSTSLGEPATVLAIILALAFLALALWIFRKSPLVSFGMLWFGAALSPVLHFIPFHELAADHFLYFPLVGVSLAVAGLALILQDYPAGWRKGCAVLLAVFALAGSGMTIYRNRAWKDQKTLWETTYAQAPGSYRANVNLGQIAFSDQKLAEGIRFTERAIELDPTKAVPRINLGALYYDLGQQASREGDYRHAKDLLHKSIEQCRAALELNPERIFAAMNYGSAYKELANIADAEGDSALAGTYRDEAEKLYLRALNSGDARKELQFAWLNLGMMYFDARKYNEAIPFFDKFIEAFGPDPQVRMGYYYKGFSLYSLGRFQSAADSFEKAAAIQVDMDILNKLVNCYEKLGDTEKKILAFEKALEIDPLSFNALYNLGLIYWERGDIEKGGNYFRQALNVDPDNHLADAIREYLGESGPRR